VLDVVLGCWHPLQGGKGHALAWSVRRARHAAAPWRGCCTPPRRLQGTIGFDQIDQSELARVKAYIADFRLQVSRLLPAPTAGRAAGRRLGALCACLCTAACVSSHPRRAPLSRRAGSTWAGASAGQTGPARCLPCLLQGGPTASTAPSSNKRSRDVCGTAASGAGAAAAAAGSGQNGGDESDESDSDFDPEGGWWL